MDRKLAGDSAPHGDKASPLFNLQQIWELNGKLLTQSRSHCVWIGVLWDSIESQQLWRERGYPDYSLCVEQEGPRGYSTIQECVRNYRFFVLGGRQTFPEYRELVLAQGIRKVTIVRQALERAAELSIPHERYGCHPGEGETSHESYGRDAGEDEPLALTADGRDGGPTQNSYSLNGGDGTPAPSSHSLTELAAKVLPLSVREAKERVAPTVYKTVHHHFRWSEHIEGFYRTSVDHIKRRVRQTIPDSYALGLLLGEYAATKAMRDPVPFEEAA